MVTGSSKVVPSGPNSTARDPVERLSVSILRRISLTTSSVCAFRTVTEIVTSSFSAFGGMETEAPAFVSLELTTPPYMVFASSRSVTCAADSVSPNVVMVEEKGVDYPRGRHNGPLLPIFKTAELTHDHLDIIYRSLADEEVDCVNGPIFRDY